jgi:hypothetical protein
LRQHTRTRRLRLAIGGGILALLIAGAAALVVARAMKPAIDSKLASKIGDLLPQISRAERPAFAAQALAELEVGRLPAPMIAALNDLSTMPPEYAAMSLAKVLTDPAVLPLWRRACPAGPRALADALRAGASDGAAICGDCPRACGRLGAPLSGHPATVAFAVLAADALAQHGSLHRVEVELLRSLAE